MKRVALAIVVTVTASHWSACAQDAADLKTPLGLATGTNGNVYVYDSGRRGIWRYGADGKQQAEVVHYANIALNGGLAVDKHGNVFFSTSTGYPVVVARFSQGGYKPSNFVMAQDAAGVAVDDNDNVYIADRKAGTISKYDPTGKHLLAVVAKQLQKPEGVAVDGKGDVYFTTLGDKKVWRAMARLGTYKVETLVSSGLESPTGVAVDNDDNLYVTDKTKGTIKKYSSSTGRLMNIVAAGLQKEKPHAVATGSNKLYLTAGNQVLQYDPSSKDFAADRYFKVRAPIQLPDFTKSATKWSLAVDRLEHVYLSLDNSIRRYDFQFNRLPDVAGILNKPWGVAVDSFRTLAYFTTYGDGDVWSATFHGLERKKIAHLRSATGIAVDGSGNIYVADRDEKTIKRFLPNGDQLPDFRTDRDFPESIAADSKGNLYFTGTIGGTQYDDTVWRAEPTSSGYNVSSFARGLAHPTGIAVDGNRNVYVADLNRGTVKRFSPGGDPLPDVADLSSPLSVAVDALGNVYVITVHSGESAVWKFYRLQAFLG